MSNTNDKKTKSRVERVREAYKESTGGLPKLIREQLPEEKPARKKTINEVYEEERAKKREEEDAKMSLADKIKRGLKKLRGEE
jgi:tRNA A37 threonylcarbamoyladenosine dehydratase